MIALSLLMKHNDADMNGQLLIKGQLKTLERVALLWMVLPKPENKAARLKRAFKIIESGNDDLSAEDKQLIIRSLKTSDFGSTRKGIQTAKAVLERIAEYQTMMQHQARVVSNANSLQLEHILPQKHEDIKSWKESWTDEDAEQWKHRLGNLALLNQKTNAKLQNRPFEQKRTLLSESPFPQTQHAGKEELWDRSTVEKFHNETIQSAIEVWHL